MRFHVGTSGFGIKEWKGTFYPANLPHSEMLGYYAERFSAVEINSSFRRMPSADVLETWAGQVPASFRFVLKAPQRITHIKRLKDVEEPTDMFLRVAAVLKRRQGPLFFQLPPNLKKDIARLQSLLNFVDNRARIAFEFRHASWFDDDVFECLRESKCALCIADAEDSPSLVLVRTANWGYVRLRRERYTNKQLGDWIKRLDSQGWREAYVFFKHEDTGTGPKLAARFLKLAAG